MEKWIVHKSIFSLRRKREFCQILNGYTNSGGGDGGGQCDPGCETVGDGGVDANGCILPLQIKCPVNIADADGDGKVCLTDYNWLLNTFNGIYDSDQSDKKMKADFNKNGMIDENDMVLLKKQYDPTKCD